MLYWLSAVSSIVIIILPFYLGLLSLAYRSWLASNANWLKPFCAGMLLFFVIDSFRDSANLGGDARTYDGLLIFLFFLVSFLILYIWGARASMGNAFIFASLLAVSIGLHSAGESAQIASVLVFISPNMVISDYLPGIIGFILHKFLEGFVLAVLFASVTERTKYMTTISITVIMLLAALGSVAGIYEALPTTYLFSAGTAGDLFILAFMMKFMKEIDRLFYLPFLAGFVLIYLLGFLHSIA